jgi:hypothetical protein
LPVNGTRAPSATATRAHVRRVHMACLVNVIVVSRVAVPHCDHSDHSMMVTSLSDGFNCSATLGLSWSCDNRCV